MTEVLVSTSGGTISAVGRESPASFAGVQPGDRLLAINGHELRDVIDYHYYSSEAELALSIERAGSVITIELAKDEAEPLGLEFDNPTFDGIQICNNKCSFCFLKGLPKGLRRSLYIKDDDYRYSFLYGNFVTLTNLTDADWTRIVEQRLSPLYVSVHATDPELRRQLLGNPRAPEILPQIDALAESGIQVHTQVVLCPGQNDGVQLERTVTELSARYPAVQSIGIVPVGLTPRQTTLLDRRARMQGVAARAALAGAELQTTSPQALPPVRCERVVPGGMRLYQPDEARAVVEQVRPWQRACRKRYGETLIHLADEFYLMADRPVPSGRYYDGYPQYENGIGMVRYLLDGWYRVRRRLNRSTAVANRHRRGAIVCGRLPAKLLRTITDGLNDLGFDLTLVPIRNDFFGSSVTVSGLLTGTDVHANLAGADFDVIFLPRNMLDIPGARTLDGWTPDDIRERLGTEVVFTTTIGTVASVLARP